MTSIKVQVSAYSGYKANERPLHFILEGKKVYILEILRQWKDPVYECFMVRGADQKTYLLKWEPESDHWFAENKTKASGKGAETDFD